MKERERKREAVGERYTVKGEELVRQDPAAAGWGNKLEENEQGTAERGKGYVKAGK